MKKKLKPEPAGNEQALVPSNGAASEPSELGSEKGHVPNAETALVLREAEEGKNLLSYANLEEMFVATSD